MLVSGKDFMFLRIMLPGGNSCEASIIMLLVSANSSMLSKPMIAPCFALYFTDAFSIGIFTTSIIEKHEQIDAQAENVERPMQTAPIVPCSLMPSSAEIMPSSRPAPAIMGETIRQNLSVLSLAYDVLRKSVMTSVFCIPARMGKSVRAPLVKFCALSSSSTIKRA